MFFIVPLFVGGPLLFIIWHWREFDSRKSYWIAFAIMVALIVSSTTWVYDYFQTHNLHFKYRAIIHTETVGEIMQDERYGGDDAQRQRQNHQNKQRTNRPLVHWRTVRTCPAIYDSAGIGIRLDNLPKQERVSGRTRTKFCHCPTVLDTKHV